MQEEIHKLKMRAMGGDAKALTELLKRLNLHFEWKEETVVLHKKAPSSPDIVSNLFGSFPSDKSSDELVKSLYDARVNQTREISL